MSEFKLPPGMLPASLVDMARRLGEQRPAPMEIGLPPLKVDRTDDLIAASLAGGMIAASGEVHTAEEALNVFRRVQEVMSESAKQQSCA